MTTTVLSAAEVRAALSMDEAIEAVRAAFRAFGAGEFELPQRTALAGGMVLTMNTHHRPSAISVVKSVTVSTGRRPAVEGVVVRLGLADSEMLVADAAAVTALRTGAVVGVATDLLSRAEATRLVLFGLGAQAPDQLRAVRAVRAVRHVTLVGLGEAEAAQFRANCSADLAGLEVVEATVGTVADAVAAADVICCATPAVEPLFAAELLGDVVHVNAVGAYRPSMRELPDELLGSAYLVVDQREAALEESGEILHALAAGAVRVDDIVELSEVLAGRRAPTAGRTVFKSVGLAIQDWAIADALAQKLPG